MDDKQVKCYIGAFADGELDVEQSLRVARAHGDGPAHHQAQSLHQQQLRQRTAKVMSEPVEAPAPLRQQLEQLAQHRAGWR